MSVLTKSGRVPAGASEAAIGRRLAEARTEVERYDRHLTAARKRRDTLIMKLVYAGFPERSIAEAAGISGSAVHQIKNAWRREHGEHDR